MSTNTAIEWTDATWNPVRGCSLVSSGCTNCYAMRQAHRFSGTGKPYEGLTRLGPNGPVWTGAARLVPEMLGLPIRWRKPLRIFVNSMSDLFHESLTHEEIAAVFGVMAACSHHTFMVLTKRPASVLQFFAWLETIADNPDSFVQRQAWARGVKLPLHAIKGTLKSHPWPLPNVRIGVSCEDQPTADLRIPLLLQIPAALRFVSYEPALGPVNFCAVPDAKTRPAEFSARYSPLGDIDLLIVGGESGPRARPCNVDWIRSAVRQCKEADVRAFVKQIGARPTLVSPNLHEWPEHVTWRMDKGGGAGVARLRDRKGGDPSEWPKDLRVRELPR